MDLKTILVSLIPAALALLFYIYYKRVDKALSSKYAIEGTIIDYKRVGLRLYPVISFVENGQEFTVEGQGMKNLKLMKVGSKVRLLIAKDGDHLSDYDAKVAMFYTIGFIIVEAIVISAEFFMK